MTEIVIGFHPIEEALKTAGVSSVLFIDQKAAKRNQILVRLATDKGVSVRRVSTADLDKMTGRGSNHKGAVLHYAPVAVKHTQLDMKTYLEELGERKDALVLFLDGITDPHNLGAILRSADLFHVDVVVVPERRSVHQNSTVMKVSAGAARYVPVVVVKNLVREMNLLQEHGFWLYGADMGGDPVHTVNMSGRVGIVMGAEGHGLGRLVRETCDKIVAIPMSGHIDSLNVSVSAGILLYEVRRGTKF